MSHSFLSREAEIARLVAELRGMVTSDLHAARALEARAVALLGGGMRGLLAKIDLARTYVGSTTATAWFRGQQDGTCALLPALFRKPVRKGDDYDERQSIRMTLQEDLVRATNYRHPVPHNKRTRELLAEHTTQSLKRWKKRLEERRTSKGDGRGDEKYRADIQKYHTVYRWWREWLSSDSSIPLVAPGEADMYFEYKFRTKGSAPRTSWELLAEMQHYDIPTRLLDWTDNAAVALYFALASLLGTTRSYLDEHPKDVRLESFKEHLSSSQTAEQPCVWVLNPYRLAEQATGRDVIWDMSDGGLDYERRFLISDLLGDNPTDGPSFPRWPYERPLPIYAPWTNPRIASQRGFFTVQGLDRRSLDTQLSAREVGHVARGADGYLVEPRDSLADVPRYVAVRVDMEWEECVECAWLLERYTGLNRFTMLRDSKSLADDIKRKYFDRLRDAPRP